MRANTSLRLVGLTLLAAAVQACGESDPAGTDAGRDAGPAGGDSGVRDAGPGLLDATADAGPGDAGPVDAAARCGNNILEGTEMCDGVDLGDETCMTHGFHTGVLQCNATCDGFLTTTCSNCGNATIDDGETCDGTALGGETCVTQGFDTGTLACNSTCTGFVTSGCSGCGNNVREAAEVCDGTDVGTHTCMSETAGARPIGSITCNDTCDMVDTSHCYTVSIQETTGLNPDKIELGNFGTMPVDISGWVVTDELDVTMGYVIPEGTVLAPGGSLMILGQDYILDYPNAMVTDYGLGTADTIRVYDDTPPFRPGGTGVLVDTTTWEVSSSVPAWCRQPVNTGPFETCDDTSTPPVTCGNNNRQGQEDCDGTDFAGVTCRTMGYVTGQMKCTSACRWDLSHCTNVVFNDICATMTDKVELINAGTTPQDISGWTLIDDMMNIPLGRLWTFPPGTVVMPGQTFTLYNWEPSPPDDDLLFGLGNTDRLMMFTGDPDMVTFTNRVEITEWPLAGAADSWCRPTPRSPSMMTCPASVCGDGNRAGREECDGADLGGKTCATLRGTGTPNGTLACSPTCTFDRSGCTP